VNDAAAYRNRYSFSAVCDVQLREDVANVHLHRILCNRKLGRYLFVPFTVCYEQQYLHFAPADRVVLYVLHQSLGDDGRNVLAAL
jgi:hypothetical protein